MSTRKRALTISGGGMHGAFAAGVVDQLRLKDPTRFGSYDIVSGTSTGSLIAPLAFLGEFEQITKYYQAANTESVYKKYSLGELGWRAVKDLLSGKLPLPSGLGTLDPLRKQLQGQVTEKLWGRLQDRAGEGKALLLATVDLSSGEVVYWGLKGPDFPSHVRIIPDRDALIDVMIASSTIPFASEPLKMPGNLGSQPFVDGGVRAETPAWICVELGATDLTVIIIQPPGLTKDASRFKDGASIVERVTSLMSYQGRTDTVRLLDGLKEYVDYKESVQAVLADDPDALAKLATIQGGGPFARAALKNLLIIRPETALPGDTLKATTEEMAKMIERGRDRVDAVLGSA